MALWVGTVAGWLDEARAVAAGVHMGITLWALLMCTLFPTRVSLSGLLAVQLLIGAGTMLDNRAYWQYFYFLGLAGSSWALPVVE